MERAGGIVAGEEELGVAARLVVRIGEGEALIFKEQVRLIRGCGIAGVMAQRIDDAGGTGQINRHAGPVPCGFPHGQRIRLAATNLQIVQFKPRRVMIVP